MTWKSLIRLALKTLLLFAAANLLLAFYPPQLPLGRLSAYNWLFPGRPRFPFGETPDLANNLSLYDLEAMFASHEAAAAKSDEFRVFVVGDSSVWGTLLRPEETLTGQLNAAAIQLCGRPARFINLGYPTLSLTKDLMILDRARELRPDLTLWLVTLESFPLERQLDSPLAANNADRIADLIARYRLPLDPNDPALVRPDFWQRTLIGRRRALADLARLQLYGPRWAATGVDQFYPEIYQPAQRDFGLETPYHGLTGPDFPAGYLDSGALAAGLGLGPSILINEPVMVSSGENSSLWYNFFYPRWAYDAYRAWLADQANLADWNYFDAWNAVPEGEFTNSPIHLTAPGEKLLAQMVKEKLSGYDCP